MQNYPSLARIYQLFNVVCVLRIVTSRFASKYHFSFYNAPTFRFAGLNGYEVFGRGTPIIYINGRQMRDATELERLKSSDIKSVEVISNPGSKYNAAVRAVVKIRTKKAVGDGFGFDVRSAYYQSENVDLSERVNWKYRHNRLELFGGHGYSLDNGHYPSKTTTIVQTDTLWQQDFTQKATEKNSIFSAPRTNSKTGNGKF